MNTAPNLETINDAAKLIMHRLIVRSLARDPSLVDRARNSLDVMSAHFPNRTFVDEWRRMLRLPVPALRNRLISRDREMARLRLSSPFVMAEGADFKDETLRRRIRRAASRIALRRPVAVTGRTGPAFV
jgi:hypothetical protein